MSAINVHTNMNYISTINIYLEYILFWIVILILTLISLIVTYIGNIKDTLPFNEGI